MASFLWGPRRGAQAYKPGSVPFRASVINLGEHVTMPLSRFLPSDSREQRSDVGLHGIAAHSVLVSPRLSLSLSGKKRDLVSVAVTKHFCLTAVNRCGALCCPDFPHLSARQTGLLYVFARSLIGSRESGVRESNPPPRLGKPMHYRCANTAIATAKLQYFLHICKFICYFLINLYDLALEAAGDLGTFKGFDILGLQSCHALRSLDDQREFRFLGTQN